MIFLDANYFLRLLVRPGSNEQSVMTDQAARLMRSIAAGTVTATTSDAILAEVVFTLRGPEYQEGEQVIATGLARILNLKGFASPNKDIWLRALAIWVERPGLGFVDSLAAAHALLNGYDLATFDRKLAKYPGLSVFRP